MSEKSISKMENRVKYMDLPALSYRSLSPSPASSSSDFGFFSRSNQRSGSSDSHCCGDLSHSVENLSNCSSECSLYEVGRPKIINIEQDLTILTAHYYKSKDNKKQRNSETSAIECVELQLSEDKKKKLQKRNKSLTSITRLLKNFSLSKSSKSLTNTPVKQKKKVEAPKSIYRRPVEYVYVKGMSGLATQRVPRKSICCQYSWTI